MSLYDKYHSDININYMYDLLCKILKEEIGREIHAITIHTICDD